MMPTDPRLAPVPDDEPSVMGAGHYPPPMPTNAEAEAIWRAAYVARMVEIGIDVDDARACCDAGGADLTKDPNDEADAELDYWDSDGDT